MVFPPWMAVALWTAAAAAGAAIHIHAAEGQTPAAVVASEDRARTLLAFTPGEARAAALQALSAAQLVEVSATLTGLAERWRLTGQNAEALGAGRLAVECAERAQDEPALARALSRLGIVLNARGDFTESIAVLQRSVTLGRQHADHTALAEALGGLSYAWFIRGDTDASLTASTESLAISRDRGTPVEVVSALNFVAMAERQRGSYDSAVARYEEAIALAEQAGAEVQLARSLSNLAVAERERGNNDRAAALFERSYPINERLGNRAGAANTLSNLGMVYQDFGRNDQALDAFLKSLATTDAIGDRVNSAATLGNLGFLYRVQGDDTVALGYYTRALELYEQLEHAVGIARIADFRARLHTSRGEYAAAEPLYRRALELRRAAGDRAGVANAEIELGAMYQAQRDFDRALAQYQRGATLLDEFGERRSLSYALLRLANVHNARGEFREALDTATRATEVCLATGQEARIWATELAAGRAWRGLGERDQARAAFERSIARIETLRDTAAGFEEDRERAFERQTDPYREMVSLLAEGEQPAAALTFAERAKGRVLLDVLRHGRADVSRVMTATERESERRLNTAIVEAAQRLQRARRPAGAGDAVQAAERDLRDARTRAEAFRTTLYTAHPELRGQRSESPPVGAADLAAMVADGRTALVEFVVAPETTFVFVVTAGDPVLTTVHRLALSVATLQRLVDDFVSALARRDLGFRTPARAVSQAVLAPLEARLRGRSRLVVVPDGPLWDLPFQALVAGDGRFLVERLAVAYATSLTALREQQARAAHRAERPRSVAAFGNPQIATRPEGSGAIRGEALAPLPAAAREARALGRLYGESSRVWVGPEATEAAFKREAGAYRTIHVATHGILNDVDPMSSHLILAPSGEGATAEDGRLQARELLGLGLDADLAVLSGCDTAKGRTGRGEGVIGLTWALFIGGVPTTVVSQWKVESESTEQLMVGLHRRLAATPAASPAEALRASATAMLASDRFRHPFYWAGFITVGDGFRPLD